MCTSAACGNVAVEPTANTTAVEEEMCDALQLTLATEFSLDPSAVTLTKCQLNIVGRRLLPKPASAQLDRALQTLNAFLCVRATVAPLLACPPALLIACVLML